ncbi:CBN-GCY-4 protein [Caenorhabditis brenneri]|uniref:Guanylate cyclase n=1 Tax=Caenorhabditis brenneri TaxID=135651 RepID=G0M8Y0_CAEBE|nr:CBN-GCY-4 protein [Caenorhabditis brenneri]
MCPYNRILFTIILIFNAFHCQNITSRPVIKVGIAAALKTQSSSIGWPYTGGAVLLALQYLRSHGYLQEFDVDEEPTHNFPPVFSKLFPYSRFHVEYTECDLFNTVKAGLSFMKTLDYDVIIGPPCALALKTMGTLSTVYKKPVLGWGFASEAELSDMSRFPYVTSVMPSSQTLGVAASKLLELYGWDRIAILYFKNELNYCNSVIKDVESALYSDYEKDTVHVVMKHELDMTNNQTFISTLQLAKTRARIILLCAQNGAEKRFYMIQAALQGMNTNEYVHILLALRSVGFGVQSATGKKPLTQNGLPPIWESFQAEPDGFEDLAKSVAAKTLVIDTNSEVLDKSFLQFMTKNIVHAVRAPPLSCSEPECLAANATGMGVYARHLFDVFYMYGMAISNLNSTDPNVYRNLSQLIPLFKTPFEGMTGDVMLNDELSRMPLFQVYSLNNQYDQISLMNISLVNDIANVTLAYKNEDVDVWHFWGGSRPLDTPICGFLGKSCPVPFFEQYQVLIFVVVTVAALLVLAIIVCLVSMIRNRRAEQHRLNSLWQIPAIKLQIPNKTSHRRKSILSIDSGTVSEDSISKSTKGPGLSEFNENYVIQVYDNEFVLTTAHQIQELTREEIIKLVKLRKLEHENLNKFIGMSIDGSRYLAVWKMCSRGSLQDIISKGNFSMDYFFMFCMIRDIAEGMNYLHKSSLRVHGNIRSATCLVNDSWQVKLADYGLEFLQNEMERPVKTRLLWMAPEVLRANIPVDQMAPSADVYSFAIVASEILTKKEAYDLHKRKEGYEEIVYLIKKGGSDLLRPNLYTDVEVNQTLLALVRDCWSENPKDRPASEDICKTLFDMTPRTKDNLMDHVFSMLEDYTSSLELEVEERTKELKLEKKKSDILLGRMLPKQVAERLKAGQAVEPESFDMVTVFFSDLVKFTDLATKCSPFQVVNLLNEVFSNFDEIIEKHDVYKVQLLQSLKMTGSVFRQIVEMSLQFMEFCKNFRIPHLPREKVQLRIGVNCGPCVAGVVGLSMPRYCLFGDTVNTASRMESNGKPSLIHMTEAAHTQLTNYFPYQYETKSNRSTPPISQVKQIPQKIPSVTDSMDEIKIRSVSPWIEKTSDNEDEEMRKIMRREMIKV